MTGAADILNADMSAVGRMIQDGFAWWTRELIDMAPAWLRGLADSRPNLTAEPAPDGSYVFMRGGKKVMPALGSGGRGTPVTLLLPPAGFLVREVVVPAMTDGDIRRLIALDIDRLTPFRAEAVYVDVAFKRGGVDEATRRRVAIAVIGRDAADEALARARSAGLDPRALGVGAARQEDTLFDFLPIIRRARGERSNRSRLLAWGAVALLLVVNLTVATLRDMGEIGHLRRVVNAQRAPRDQVLRLRRQVLDETARRVLVARSHGQGEPLRALDAATRALPDGAWVQRLSWDGKAMRLAGYRQANVDVVTALRASPLLTNVRNSTGDSLGRTAAGQPFDVTADMLGATAPTGRP
jgi:general secretion pathway protein L